MLLLLLTTFCIASTRKRNNLAGVKSVSLALQSPTCVTKTLVVILLISGTARIDRVDPGTENVKVEVLQKFLGPTDATLCSISGKKVLCAENPQQIC